MMDIDNQLIVERYYGTTHNSPYEKTMGISKHTKFVEPQNFESKLMTIYSESGTSNVASIYKLLHENFKNVDMQLSHSEGYKHLYCAVVGDYEIEGCQVHFLHPKPKVTLYENTSLDKWSSLTIFKRGTSTALFRL